MPAAQPTDGPDPAQAPTPLPRPDRDRRWTAGYQWRGDEAERQSQTTRLDRTA